MKTKNVKRFLALLMAVIMTLGTFYALADPLPEEDPTDQIHYEGGYLCYDEEGNEVAHGAEGTLVDESIVGAEWVHVSKTITDTVNGQKLPENEFEITLEVQTKVDISEVKLSEDAAVVLVIDVSGSMAYCSKCGAGVSHTTNCSYRVDTGNGTVTEAQSRLAEAKAAVVGFLDTYGTSAAGTEAKRLVSLAGFSTNAKAYPVGDEYWIDVADSDNLAAVKAVVQGMTADGNTNVEGGLMVAENLFRTTDGGEAFKNYSEITNRSVILLTDGAANRHANSSSQNIMDHRTTVSGTSSNNTSDAESRAKTVAGRIKNGSAATLYTVRYGSSNAQFLKDLATSDDTALDATQSGSLAIKFQEIANNIRMWAEAWTVTDPMGENITWKPGQSLNAEKGEAFITATNTFSWDLKKADRVGELPDPGTGWYTYTHTYRIILDNTADGFAPNTPVATNGDTYLTYVIMKDGENLTGDRPAEADFEVPEVIGFSDNLSFNKLITGLETPIKGVVFTLTTADDPDFEMEAISNEDGEVTFSDIPSGHNYTLTETSAPVEIAVPDGVVWAIKVSYGDLTYNSAGFPGTVYNDVRTEKKNITVNKSWINASGNSYDQDVDITLVGKDSLSNEVYNGTLTLKAGESSVIFTDLDKYDHLGKLIAYTASDSVNGYSEAIGAEDKENQGVINLVNILEHGEEISINGEKIWLDGDSVSDRPENITVELWRNGVCYKETTASAPDWGFSFTGLPKYYVTRDDNDKVTAISLYVYTVKEKGEVNGFITLEGVDYSVTYGSGSNHDITNTRTGTLEIPVTKAWIIPSGAPQDDLFAWVTLTGGDDIEPVKLDSGNNWTHTFEVRKYNNLGVPITYTATETEWSDGYEWLSTTGNMAEGFVITNQEAAFAVNVIKRWRDDVDPESRPDVTFTLYADGTEVETKTLYAPDTNLSFTGLEKYKYVFVPTEPADPGESPDPSAPPESEGEWKYVEIVYTVVEAPVDGYSSALTGTLLHDNGISFVFTNTRLPGSVTITANKTWVDQNNEFGTRPAISFTLMKQAGNDWIDVQTLDYEGSPVTFTAPKYDGAGKTIIYSVRENIDKDAPYSTSNSGLTFEGDVGTITFTNTLTQQETEYNGVKIWNLDPEWDSPPEAITIQLYKNGEPFGDPRDVSLDKHGAFSISGLEKYTIVGGVYTLNVYTVKECDPDGNVLENSESFVLGETEFRVSYDENVITNSYVDPDVYMYQVVVYYRTVTNGVPGPWSSAQLKYSRQGVKDGTYTLAEAISSGENVSGVLEAWKTFGGLSDYSLLTSPRTASVTLTDPAVVPRIEYYYERSFTGGIIIPNPSPPVTEIPEESPPLVDIPEESPPLVDIPEESPPLTGVEIIDEDTPLGDLPQTGTPGIVLGGSALGLLVIFTTVFGVLPNINRKKGKHCKR